MMQDAMDAMDLFDSGAGLYANLWAGLPFPEGGAVDMDAVRDGFAQVEEEDRTPSYFGTGGAGKQAAKGGGKGFYSTESGKASRKKVPQKKVPRKGEVYRQTLMATESEEEESEESEESEEEEESEARKATHKKAAQMAARSKMQAYAARVAAQAQGSSSGSDSD